MAKILVVDDDLALRCFIEDSLTEEQHQVDTAADGLQGWNQMQSQQYDLVILDWDMPGLSGVELIKRFRAEGGTTPVLLLTGRSKGSEKAMGLDLGADDYLTKPFELEELSARIRASLRKQQAVSRAPKPLGTNNEELLNRANLIGTTLAARYEFIEALGEGGVGIVFKARHPHLDKLVAIKMLLMPGLKNEALARFEQEAKLVSRLEHPGIAHVYDFGVTERSQSYMVMEYIEGQGLEVILRQHFCLKLKPALEFAIQLCDAMAHAHGKGIIHRDLKPSNIMLKLTTDAPPILKVLDFGCGKLRDLSAEQGISLTQDGRVFGSPPYMSPEQVRAQPADERSDIYSLGCVIHEMLTGYPPFLGKHPTEIMFKHLEDEVSPLSKIRPDLTFPGELDDLLGKALQKDPAKRYQSMLELKADLERIALNAGT